MINQMVNCENFKMKQKRFCIKKNSKNAIKNSLTFKLKKSTLALLDQLLVRPDYIFSTNLMFLLKSFTRKYDLTLDLLSFF